MNRRHLNLTKAADEDLLRIRAYSNDTHGSEMAEAYNSLIRQAFKDLAYDPYRAGSKARSDLADGIRSYHIKLSRKTARSSIRSPRHLVFYFTADEDKLVISRVLHDAQDFTRTMAEMRDHVMEYAANAKKQGHDIPETGATDKKNPPKGKSKKRDDWQR